MKKNAIVIGAIAGLWMGAALGQERGNAAADDVALAIEFQQILDTYQALSKRPAGKEDRAKWRDDVKPKLDTLIGQLKSLAERVEYPGDVRLVQALCHAQRAELVLGFRQEIDREYFLLEESYEKDRSSELSARLKKLASDRSKLADRAAEEYQELEEVLRKALADADALQASPEGRRQKNLVLGVVLAQSAIVQARALDSADDAGTTTLIQISGPDLRDLLDSAQKLVINYLDPELTSKETDGLEWVRGQFYLGVIEYRRSLTVRVKGEKYYTEVDKDDPERVAAFEAARTVFEGLSDKDAVYVILHPYEDRDEQKRSRAGRAFEASSFFQISHYSYKAVANFYAATANMYLGLIAAVDAQFKGQLPEVREEAVEGFFVKAERLDFYEPQPGQAPISLTSGTVEQSHKNIMKGLAEIAQAVERREPLNDLTISFGLTPIYDTNVPLLGRHTRPPLDKGRKRDFRIGSSLKLEYVADLDAFVEDENPGLAKWQLFLEGRVAPTWNARIRDFNEQFYGGAVNLRYELMGAQAEGEGPIDGLFLHLRYAYDYLMLHNDGFLRINSVRPSLQLVAFDQVLNTSLYFNYEDRNYLEVLRDERFDRDGNYVFWGLDVLLDLGKWVNAEKLWGPDKVWGPMSPIPEDRDEYERPWEIFLALEFAHASTQGDEFDYDGQLFSVGTRVPLPYGIDFTARGLFEWQDYRKHSLVDHRRRRREDFIQEYAFRLQRKFFLSSYGRDFQYVKPLRFDRVVMTVFGDLRFTLDDSNVRDRLGQNIFEYNRTIYSAGVRFDIN